MKDMVRYRVSLGYSASSYEGRLRQLDRYISENYPGETVLTEKIVLGFIAERHDSKVSARQNRAGIARLFAEYLMSIGEDAYLLPKGYVSGRRNRFLPYIFSDHELRELFCAVDQIRNGNDIMKRCTASVMLRLIYTCGLRPGEGLRLKKENVNLESGEMLITETKLKKEQIVVLHNDMVELMRRFSLKVSLSGRDESIYFFPAQDCGAYSTSWLEEIMKCCYRKANPGIPKENLPHVRVYDLRHRFASATLCRWLDEGKDLYNMLPYLRTYMGHSSLSQTAYYIHILPENLMKSRKIDWNKLNDIIPEDEV